MENAKESGDKTTDGNPNPNSNPNPSAGEDEPRAVPSAAEAAEQAVARARTRTPFTSLSQVDADLALARALQEQERAYMMLRMNGGEGSDYGSSEAGSYDVEGSDYGEDAFDANAHELDPADFEDDEAFARALQDAEEREVAVRLMALAGLNDWRAADHEVEEEEDESNSQMNDQDAWQEVDPEEYTYEELIALGDVVGTESRGLSADTIASLPSANYKAQNVQDGNTEQCVICRVEYEEGENLVVLSCNHTYHPECINKWLQINKVCPMCSAEVSTSENRQE
uniref:RING-type domain-containing protein n=1 Tax=Ananas comosus var. bracteatus TaxID=296719 RepID=A0A6V7PHV7_ANACO|nr:unnamed protein product [Ananas comosus var. bracteatus]